MVSPKACRERKDLSQTRQARASGHAYLKSTNYFLGQDYFSQGKKKGAHNKKKRAVIIHVPYECDPALLPGGSGILPAYLFIRGVIYPH